MTAHTCRRPNRGCFRCELNLDEMRGALHEVEGDLAAAMHDDEADYDEIQELTRERDGLRDSVRRWETVLEPLEPLT